MFETSAQPVDTGAPPVLALLLGVPVPQLDFLTRGIRWLLPALAAWRHALLVATSSAAGYDTENPGRVRSSIY
jgi:hypothetical protein